MKVSFHITEDSTEKSFSTDFVDPQLNLLAHAQSIECGLGSECGGHGICGRDRIRVSSAEASVNLGPPVLSPLTEAERLHLSKREIDEGWRLACQVFPENAVHALKVEVLQGQAPPG